MSQPTSLQGGQERREEMGSLAERNIEAEGRQLFLSEVSATPASHGSQLVLSGKTSPSSQIIRTLKWRCFQITA
jgi:hypothetical protein